jgi:superfamily II DNA or RNA helicase
MQNFKKYYLEEIKRVAGSDPCAVTEERIALRKYQEFVGKFMDYTSPYKSIMLYHGLGSGKTCSSIAIAEGIKNDKKVLILTN